MMMRLRPAPIVIPSKTQLFKQNSSLLSKLAGVTVGSLFTVEVPRAPGVHAYPFRLLRRRMEPAHRVGSPRHLIVYRLGTDQVVEILGLVHDRMVLSRAARRMVRTAYKG